MAKKKPINSKKKGAGYERTIAKLLSTWWDADFRKTPASGGLHWGTDNRVVGDIVSPPDSLFPFVVECKKRENWNFSQIIKGTGDFIKYWEQVCTDVDRLQDDTMHPLVIMSKNHQPNYYVVEKSVFDKLGCTKLNCFITTIKYQVHEEERETEIAIGMLNDLLAIPKETVINALKND